MKILVIGTSMNENLLEFMPYSFKHTKFIRINDVDGINVKEEYKIMERFSSAIKEYNPDIMVLSLKLANFYKFNKFDKGE